MKQDTLISRKRQEYAYRMLKSNRMGLRRDALQDLIHKSLGPGEIRSVVKYLGKGLITLAESGKKVRCLRSRRVAKDGVLEPDDLQQEIKYMLELAPSDSESFQGLIELAAFNDFDLYLDTIQRVEKLLKRKSARPVKRSNLLTNLQEIKKVFELSEKEVEILLFFYLIEGDYYLGKALGDRRIGKEDWYQSLKFICRFFTLSPKQMRDLFNKDSKLVRSGIMKKKEDGVELASHVKNYLSGLSNMDLVDSFFSTRKNKVNLVLEDHVMSANGMAAVRALMVGRKGNNILIYGSPGTGKTQFLFSLGEELGREIYWIKQHNPDGNEDLAHRKSSIVAALSCLPKDVIIAVDECDPVVNSVNPYWPCENVDNDSKAWINDLLENSQHKIIWISNKVDGIDESTKRRFSFSYEFKKMTHKQRQKVWETVLEKSKVDFVHQKDIEIYAKQYSINAGGISLAVNDVASMKSLKNKKQQRIMLNTLLAQHEKFVFNQSRALTKKNSKYNLDVVNSNGDLNGLIGEVGKFYTYLEDHPTGSEITNLSILLAGPSGTGKTEYAKHLAESVGKDLVLRRLSDIRSKWYGESLKNIATMFSEAQDNDSILFLDEADSFFLDRETSHEHGREETNEILTQMENFRGVLVCSTNLMDGMDAAVMRRFSNKINFDFLDSSGVKTLFYEFFEEKLTRGPTSAEVKRLESITHLTPGDYKVVRQKNFFKDGLDPSELINQLELEREYKKGVKNRIGLAL